ncbi:phospholipid carrier-dependent glycosyltransferase, partial [Ruegeria sp.]|uniref:ArnT family glycosyltransferase n=1 Tax=Ruegeria sp. TaxID=1879320 RepID=UPI00231FB79D
MGIFTLPFTDTTEARYAEIARKMVETQDWITPQFAYDVPFWGKPPLHTWLSAAGMEIFGINAFGARILIFACAIAILALMYRWLRDEMGSGAALSAVVVLSSSVLFFGASAFVMTDLAMT